MPSRSGSRKPRCRRHALRFADTVAALAVGSRTREARALAGVYGNRTEPAYMAATIRLTELDDIDLRTCTTPSAVVVPVVLDAARRAHFHTGRGRARFARRLRRDGACGTRCGRDRSARARRVAHARRRAARRGRRSRVALRIAARTRRGGDAAGFVALGSARAGATIAPLPSRWWLFGESVAAGITSAAAAAAGFTADTHLDAPFAEAFSGPDGADACGWISQKTFPGARQGANALVAFRDLLRDEDVDPKSIAHVEVEVPPPCVRVISQTL